MNLKLSGLLFVLILVTEAINGLGVDSASNATKPTPEVTTQPEKSQTTENGSVDSIKLIIHSNNEILKPGSSNTTVVIPPTPTSTASPPTSTTTAPPTPEKGTWVVRNETSKTTCIIAEMMMQLNITYPGNNVSQENEVIYVPKTASANGECSNDTQVMNITWGPGYSLQINFRANKSANTFYVSGLSLTVNATVLKDAKVDGNNTEWNFVNGSTEFVTPLDMSYKCNEVQDINLKGDNETLKAVLSLKNAQLEAFMNKTSPTFGAAQDCEAFDTPDIVPIAVGCALAILVLVVLIAYVIGRKRSQNRGYLSM